MSMPIKYDFCGYATKNDLKCADGRTIRRNAFKDCDGAIVPLVWGHKHDDPSKVLGRVFLENRDDGVFAYGEFNDTESGKNAKELVRHGDIKALSIYANQLKQKGGNVLHGMIREVSLVLAGANPGARIEDLSFEHDFDEDSDDFEALIFNGYNIMPPQMPMMHAAQRPMMPPVPPMPLRPMMPVRPMIPPVPPMPMRPMMPPPQLMHADAPAQAIKNGDKPMANEMTVGDVFNTLNPDQKTVVYFIIGQLLAARNKNDDSQEDDNMSHNLFENGNNAALMHDALSAVIDDAKKYGSLKDSYEHHMTEGALAHAIDTTGMEVPEMSNTEYAQAVGYGINSPDFLFPDARTIGNEPIFIKRDTDWVDIVLRGTHKSAFARIKSIFANITEDEARAKGYMKGHLKKDEFFSVMKRVTTPQTVYKRQRMDRDDIIDITDFDVVAMIKTEMRSMLNEELARAILIGDGRSVNDDDKINEANIRPIALDHDLFSIKQSVTVGSSDEATAKNMMKAALRARKDYKGSGNPTMFTTEEWLTNMLLIEDGIGHYMYKSVSELATALRVRDIVTVPVMEGFKDATNHDVLAIIVNLNDYNVGADKGGAINMFDDFNIDYNRYVYLIETRCSGALIRPYSAIVLSKATPSNSSSGSDSGNESTGG